MNANNPVSYEGIYRLLEELIEEQKREAFQFEEGRIVQKKRKVKKPDKENDEREKGLEMCDAIDGCQERLANLVPFSRVAQNTRRRVVSVAR